MKIVGIDNFNRETVNDCLAAQNVPPLYAEVVAEALNAKFSGDHSPIYFVVRPDQYELYRFEP